MAKRGEIRHGDDVRDSITGYEGVAVAITTWMNGCERVTIQARALHEGKPVDAETFDVEQLEVKKRANRAEPPDSGGPHAAPTRPRTPSRT